MSARLPRAKTASASWPQRPPVATARSRQLGSSALLFAQGSYVGNGGTQAVTGLGFRPKAAIVKADHATNGNAMYRTDTKTVARNLTNSVTDQGIASLDNNGFTVSHIAGGVGRTNEVGKTYYWWVVGGANIVTGTYLSTGVDNLAITGLGILPELVIVDRAATSSPPYRTRAMGVEDYDFAVSLGETNRIKSLDSNGFTVGTNIDVNPATPTTVHYLAIAISANLAVGVYAGNSVDNRDLPAIALAFNPALVQIKADAGQEAVHKTLSLTGDATLQYGSTAQVTNRIQSLTPSAGKFQVGTDAEVNNTVITAYYWFAIGANTVQELSSIEGNAGVALATRPPIGKGNK